MWAWARWIRLVGADQRDAMPWQDPHRSITDDKDMWREATFTMARGENRKLGGSKGFQGCAG
jgi:hypothetical protein